MQHVQLNTGYDSYGWRVQECHGNTFRALHHFRSLFINSREGIPRVLHHCLANGEDVKVFTTTSVTMQKINISDGKVDEEKTFYFSSKAVPIQTESDIE